MRKQKANQRNVGALLMNVPGLTPSQGSATEFDYDCSQSKSECSQIHLAVLPERVDVMVVFPTGGDALAKRVKTQRHRENLARCLQVSRHIQFQHARVFDSIYLAVCSVHFKGRQPDEIAIQLRLLLRELLRPPGV